MDYDENTLNSTPTMGPDGVGRDINDVGLGRNGARPSQVSTFSEADVLRRKLALTRAVKTISAENRVDSEFAKYVEKAEDELAVAEEACKFGRFAAASESLDVAEKALDDLRAAKQAQAEAEPKAMEMNKHESDRSVKQDGTKHETSGVVVLFSNLKKRKNKGAL